MDAEAVPVPLFDDGRQAEAGNLPVPVVSRFDSLRPLQAMDVPDLRSFRLHGGMDDLAGYTVPQDSFSRFVCTSAGDQPVQVVL